MNDELQCWEDWYGIDLGLRCVLSNRKPWHWNVTHTQSSRRPTSALSGAPTPECNRQHWPLGHQSVTGMRGVRYRASVTMTLRAEQILRSSIIEGVMWKCDLPRSVYWVLSLICSQSPSLLQCRPFLTEPLSRWLIDWPVLYPFGTTSTVCIVKACKESHG